MRKILLLIVFSFFIASTLTSRSLAQAPGTCAGPNCYQCKPADVKKTSDGVHWDITYCVTANTPQQLDQLTSGKMTCRRAPDTATGFLTPDNQNCSCRDDYNLDDLFLDGPLPGPIDDNTIPDPRYALLIATCGIASLTDVRDLETYEQDLPHEYDTLQDPDTGKYYTCFTFKNLDRNMGAIDTELSYPGGTIKCDRMNDVAPKDYTWAEYWDNTLESTLGFGIITDPTERGPKDLFCSTVEGKGTADNPFSLLTGITNPAINTALGCIATDPVGFTRDYLTLAIGIGGPIALILLLYAFFTIATAGGNPAKVQQGKEIISGVVQGLIVIILSVVLLGFLGINLLGLPGLI